MTPYRRREVERAVDRAHRQEPGIRQRSQPRYRPRGQGDRGTRLPLHSDHDGQQRADRPPHQRGERDRHRQRQPGAQGARNRCTPRATAASSEAVSRSIKELRETAEMATQSATKTITRTLRELQETTQAAVEQSKQTAAAAVSEIVETQGMLRADTHRPVRAPARGQHPAAGGAERRAREHERHRKHPGHARFGVRRRHERRRAEDRRRQRSGGAADRRIPGNRHPGAHRPHPARRPVRLAWTRARRGGGADRSQQPPHRGRGDRAASRAGSAGHHARQQGQRPRAAPDPLLQPARPVAGRRGGTGARDFPPGRRVDDLGGARAIAENFESIRTNAEEERKRATEAMHGIYEQATGESQSMLAQSAERFADVVEGLKHMSSDMQRELEATRSGAAPGHPRTAAGDRRKRRPDAPRDRRPDRGAGRAQSHRRPPRPQPGRGRAGGRAESRRSRPRRRAAWRRARPCSPMAVHAPSRHGSAPTSPAVSPAIDADPPGGSAITEPGRPAAPQGGGGRTGLALRPAHPRLAGARDGAPAAAESAAPPREPPPLRPEAPGRAARGRARAATRRASSASNRSIRSRSTSHA